MSLDNIPTKTTIEIETVKIDESVLEELKSLNATLNNYVTSFGNLYLRRKDLQDEMRRLDETNFKLEEEFKQKNEDMRKLMDELDEKYPMGRINLADGTVQYQPGAPSKKQLEEQQKNQMSANQ